jgi:hypothetical protein
VLAQHNKSQARWLESGSFAGFANEEIKIALSDNPVLAQQIAAIFADNDFRALAKDFFGRALTFRVIVQNDAQASDSDKLGGAEITHGTDNGVSEKERIALQESPITRQIMAAYPDARIAEIRRRTLPPEKNTETRR